jgi:hypothetical protein
MLVIYILQVTLWPDQAYFKSIPGQAKKNVSKLKMEEVMKIKKIIIRDFEEIIAELKKVLSKMRTNFLGDEHPVTE